MSTDDDTQEKLTTDEVLYRIGMLQDSARTLGNSLGRYVYAYYDPMEWRCRIKSPWFEQEFQDEERPALEVPSPFYIGIGKGRRFADHIDEALNEEPGAKRDRIRELIDQGLAPDIRFLTFNLPMDDDETVTGRDLSLHLETVLLNLYGATRPSSERGHFDERMGYPAALTNKARSSTAIQAGSVAAASTYVHAEGDTDEDLLDPADIVTQIQEAYNVDNVLFIGISGAHDDMANIDQLKAITCEWWNADAINRDPTGEGPLGQGDFVVLGWKSDPSFTWVHSSEPHRGPQHTVPLIRSAFRVSAGDYLWTEDESRVSFVHRAEFDEDLWRDYVGWHIDRTANQMQGQKWNQVGTGNGADTETLAEDEA